MVLGVVGHVMITLLLPSVPVRVFKIWKLVNIWCCYDNNLVVYFLDSPCSSFSFVQIKC